jgi:glucose-1-phosphate thymidylyltransferase
MPPAPAPESVTDASSSPDAAAGIDAAVVLAGGEGRRLRPLTRYRPKPLLPGGTRPILDHVLDAVVEAGVDDLHLVVGYGRERVQNHVGPTYRGRRVSYHRQPNQLGTGHALLQAEDGVDDTFLVVNGDEVVTAGMIGDVVATHTAARETGPAPATLAVVESAAAGEYGAVRLDGGSIAELVEKPATDDYRLMNAGVYALDRSVFDAIRRTGHRRGELRLTDAIARLVEAGDPVRGVETEGLLSSVDYPWDLLGLVESLLAAGLTGEPEREPGVYAADSARLHDDASLVPPVALGPDAVVGPRAVVGPAVAVGRGATVGPGAFVRRSIVDEGVRLGPNAAASDAFVGADATLGANATVPGGPGDVRVGDRVHEDVPVGGLIAERARVGANATVLAGTMIGPEAAVDPGVVVDRNVDEGAEVRR